MTTGTLPPGPSAPRPLQALYTLVASRRGLPRLRDRYGDAFTVSLPIAGRVVVISDPAEVRQLFQVTPDVADQVDRNISRILGPGSLFGLRGEEHHRQRKLLVPPFHGRRLVAYEKIVEDETVRELASWPEDRPFSTMPSMMRITLNAILRAVFGAEGAEFTELRELLPRLVALGAPLAVLPIPDIKLGGRGRWERFRAIRRGYDDVVERLLVRARQDGLDGRDDILAMMLQSRYDDGSSMGVGEISDQLLTLLTAGHETTATTLAWAVERLRRHPEVLRGLVEEVDAGGDALRQATITEVQRTRPVVETVARQVRAESLQLGRWTLPKGSVVLVGVGLIHSDESVFPNARTFDPSRFLDNKPDRYQWVPFGGGARRCLGAAFANMEMNVVLRTMLRDFALLPTDERAERWRLRGITNAPAKGGRAVVRRRAARPVSPAASASAETTDPTRSTDVPTAS